MELREPTYVQIADSEHKNKKPKIVILTPLASDAIQMLMKRDTDDHRIFQFKSKTDKGKRANLFRLFEQATFEALYRPLLTIHQLRKENASQ